MITYWFTPDEKATIQPDRLSKRSLWHQVIFLQELDRPLVEGDLLVISFDRHSSHKIKKQLYQFNGAPSSALKIIDCGFVNQKDHETLLPVFKELVDCGVMLLLITPPLSFMRYQIQEAKMVSVIRESNLDDDVLLRTENPSQLIQYIGTQRHLIAEANHRVEGHLRLSDLREDIILAEPCLRDSEALIFHCDSMSASEAGYMTGMSASGLTIVEACQLFRYAGAAPFISTVGIYGYSLESDGAGMTSNAIAQMIWYLLEGSTMREDPDQTPLSQYVVQSKDHEFSLQFYKSEVSGRWWIENKSGRKVPCSYNDYRKACDEDYSAIVIKSTLG